MTYGPLDLVESYLSRFVAYPSEHALVAHSLWVAHTHAMQCWESTPRIAFNSPERGSGKTRALEVTETLVPNRIHAVNVTPAYLFRKVGDEEAGLPTILYDEVDTLFGSKVQDTGEVRGLLNAGHRRGAKAGRCIIVGKKVMTEEIPAYCAVALAGLGNLSDTIASRSILIDMRRRAPDEEVEPFRHRYHADEAKPIKEALAEWCAEYEAEVYGANPEMPGGVEDRDADCWEPLLAIADVAGADWPDGHGKLLLRSLPGQPSGHKRAGCSSCPISMRYLGVPRSFLPKPSFTDCMSYPNRLGRTYTASHSINGDLPRGLSGTASSPRW